MISTRDFVTRLTESGLLASQPPELMDALLGLPSAQAAAKELISRNLLTEFQAQVIANDERIPLIIGDYIVQSSLGRGGMGYVLKARHRRMKRDVAIKFLLKELTAADDAKRRFEREVEAAAQLNHQNIVTAYDAGEHTDGSCYLVMQYVDGQDLSHFVKANGPVTISQAVNIISQAAEGLAFAHDQGIVHRDIKPGNLLLDKQGIVRILDMGLARMRPSPGDSLAGGAHADLTNTGSVMGTIDYMAPEQALDAKSADHRADIYSLGCTLWFLLSGNPPYREDTIMRRLLAHREQQIPSVRSVLPQAPSELEEILHRMMAKSKDDRFPSMRHLLVALQGLELDDTESEQIATLDMPDDGSGGFIKLPENESFGRPASRTAPLQLNDSQMRHAKPVSSATSAPPSHPDAATVVAPERSEATDATVTFQADQSQITSAPIKSVEHGSTTSSAPASRHKLAMLAIGSLLLAVIAAFAFRGGKPTDRESDPAKVATAKPTPDVPATASNVAIPTPMPPIAVASVSDAVDYDAERKAAEWVLKRGSNLWISDENGQGIAVVDGKLPTTKFFLGGAELYGKAEPLTDADLLNLARCRRLAGLDLRKEKKITAAGMQSLAAVTSLWNLDLRETRLGDELLPHLTNWPKLTHLLIGDFENPDIPDIAVITDAGLRNLPQLPGVVHLDIGSRRITDEGLALICERIPNLKYLRIAHKETASFRPLQRLTGLQTLLCYGAHLMADGSIEALQSLPNLEDLTIVGAFVPGTLISRLASLRERLARLHISGYLNLTDEPRWQQLREFKRLSNLDIAAGTASGSFSDDDLESLAQIPTLTNLKVLVPLDSRFYTPAGIVKFRQMRPDVQLQLNDQHYPATAAKPNWPAGTPNAATAPFDAALKFDGKQSHVRTPLVHGGDTPLTIEFTLLPGPKQYAVVSDSEAKGMGIDILGSSISFLAFRRANGKEDYVRITSPRPLTVDRTYRVATVYDSGKLRLFVDGKLEASAELKGEYLPSNLPFYLGASPEEQGIDYPMTGTLDEVRFSKVARYQTDYSPAARLTTDADTLALYHFDEGTGDVLRDSSGNNRHGKIVAPTWVRVDPKSESTTNATAPTFTNDILLLGDGFFSRWRAATGTAALEHIFSDRTLNNGAVATSAVATVLDDLRNQKFAAVVPKVVIVQAGYADISRNVPLPESTENYRQLVNQLRHEFPASALVLTSVLPKSELGEQCKALNKAIQQLADNKTAHYVDLDPVFLDSAGNIQTDLLKGVDLSLAGYRALGAALKPTVERLLSVPTAKPVEPDPAKAPFDAKTARAHQEAWAKHLGTIVETTNSVDTKMILIPLGEFLMGNTDEQVDAAVKLAEAGGVEAGRIDRIRKSKRPQHRAVVAQPFRMARTEVTIAEFRAFVTDTGYITDAERFGQGNTSSQAITNTTADSKKSFIWKAPGYDPYDTFPVTQVSWNDANAYCRWLSQKEQATYRLPTETEWEFACRAGTSTQYSFGDTASELDQYGWYIGNANSNCHPVATRQANPFGLFDMHGNMEEWCGSKFEEDGPSEKPKDTVPASSTNATYAVRGGHWYHNPAFCRSAYRDLSPPTLRFNTLGFRVVSEISRPAAVPVVVPSSVAKPVAPQPTKAPFGAEQAHVHQVAWAQHLSTQVETSNRVGAKMILIPPGEYLMGSTPEEIAAGLKIVDEAKLSPTAFERSRIPEEQPQHKVTITRPFCIGATEVTVGQYRRFVDATKYLTQGEQFGAGNASTWTAPKDSKPENVQITWRAPGYSTTDEHPVTQVTWGDAVAYCNWLSEEELLDPCYESSGKLDWKLIPGANGYRLPTEAEWEYACRAGTTTQFSFGDQASHIGEHGWTGEVKAGHPQPVARKLPNPFGLFDMHGNTREWCHDWYSSEVYAEPSRVDPIGSDFGTDRVMRGGRWNAHSVSARSAFRYDINPFLRNTQGGFRVVRSPYTPPNATTILVSPAYEWSEPQNLGAAVNSSQSDANPFLTPDGLTLIFSSNRAQGQSGLDLWESRRASVEESFQTSTNLPRVVNSFATDDSPSLSADSLQIVFASDRPGSEGDLDLYLCRRADPQEKWGPPLPLNPPVNTDQREECGAFSPDGLTLYFASNRPNGLGAMDIWSARRSSLSDPFGPPENLGSTVNSADDETHFRPTADGRGAVLCRRASDGRHSLWLVLRKGQTGPFGTARMLDPIAGGDGSVRSPGISADGRTLYFQAKRDGGQGDFDLWFVRRVPKSKTEPTPRKTR